jgi:lipopolysaccharide/colanic/teichoic acid biosynthesis glycosyltransferase
MPPKHVPSPGQPTGAASFSTQPKAALGQDKPRIIPAEVKSCFAITPAMRAWSAPMKAGRRQVDATLPENDTLGGAEIPFPRWKRAIDLAACLLALPILGLCTLVMWLLTKRFAPGPVLFRQERIGHLGRRFSIYKFRTMKVGADCSIHQNYCKDLIHSNAPMVKLDSRGDARLIPMAWVLRASGLDELPQVINVLRGEMSLVGPRPCIPAEFEHYAPWQRRRCDARPGLTELWQVSGKNRTTFEQMIRLDIKYARELSFWLDLKIIFSTLPCLLAQVRDSRRARESPSAADHRRPAEMPDGVLSNGLGRPAVAPANDRPAS